MKHAWEVDLAAAVSSSVSVQFADIFSEQAQSSQIVHVNDI